jgi:hypothetical protein
MSQEQATPWLSCGRTPANPQAPPSQSPAHLHPPMNSPRSREKSRTVLRTTLRHLTSAPRRYLGRHACRQHPAAPNLTSGPLFCPLKNPLRLVRPDPDVCQSRRQAAYLIHAPWGRILSCEEPRDALVQLNSHLRVSMHDHAIRLGMAWHGMA